jgi:hypothetical protein
MRIKGRQVKCEGLYNYWTGMHIDGAGDDAHNNETIVIRI